jgi:hypothetical protein
LTVSKFFSFPNPVDNAAARTVGVGVTLLCLLTFFTGWAWLLIPLTYGFAARVAAGPKISPLGTFAVRVAAPRLKKWQGPVPGPPKRFAQSMGLAFCLATLITWLSAGWLDARWILLPLVVAAGLEGFFGYCLGCTIFAWLIRRGVVPESVCVECANLSQRYKRVPRPLV